MGDEQKKQDRESTEEMKDMLAEMRATFDQAHEAVKDMTKLIAQFYAGLIAEGMDAYDALQLTREWMRIQMGREDD